MKPLISIIIPTYNRAHLINEALDSVLAQTYFNWQCIIIDDGSTDDSVEIIQKYLDLDSRFLCFSRPDNKKKGPSSCRNFGLLQACGDYVIFLDSDDLLATTCLENRIQFALQNKEYDFWIFKMQTFGYNQAPVFDYGFGAYEDENGYCRNQFSKGNHPFVVTCPLWKKNVLLDLQGFNENLFMYEDPELHLRSLKKGYKLKFTNFEQPDCFYRLKEEIRIDIINNLKNNYVFFENHLDCNDINSILYYKQIINNVILKSGSIGQYFKFCKLGIEKRILSKKNIFCGMIVLTYHFFKFYNLKGIGYNYFKTQFNNF
ncbi:glycosyltransferase family 2 protein [Flavobacterium sp. KMS]|uniref:glycosyltransferase family 2 protein n=1 Tax=unclassified Flavobacterium TaxID=196869 RepID=UPI00068BC367|nr:glycosyltransferase family 2 protein [Flavobacterium sp. KMS]